jgi:TPR repeat protein
MIAALFICLTGGEPARADFAAGIEAYSQGDYRAALDEWLPYAAENDSRALFNLGQMYRLGQGVDKDMAIAEQYYRRAARQGHPAARGNLGSIYYTRTPPQIDEALYYWRAAARDGDVRSQYLLGVQYFNGEHVAKDHVLAYAWISLAAEAGLQEAKDALQVLAKFLSEEDISEGKRLSHTFDIPETESATPVKEEVVK